MCEMSNISCALMVVLIILSVANLLLLSYVIYQSIRASSSNEKVDIFEQFSQDQTINKVITRRNVPLANYKFIAAIVVLHHRNRYDSDMVICGASIISKHWVLTAAHCTELLIEVPLDNIRVSANSSLWQNGVWHKVKRIIMHENYDGFSLLNDISLISVLDPFNGKYEAPISIAGSRYPYTDNSGVSVLGWSSTKSTLYGLDMQMFSHKYCETKYSQVDLPHTQLFCAGNYNKQSSCIFDFGGPVVQKNVLIGIVSYRGDCERDRPGVYTKVGIYEHWFKYIEKRFSVKIAMRFV